MVTTSREVRIEVSTKCNYNCQICARQYMRRLQQIMPTEIFRMLLDKIQAETHGQFKFCDFSGMGEPLMDPDLVSKIAFAANGHKMTTILITNGSLLTPDRFFELQRAGLNYVRISMHEIPGNINAYTAAHGCNEAQAIAARYNILDILSGPRAAKVGIHITTQEAYEDQIEEIKTYFKGADSIEIWRPHNWAGAFAFRPQSKRKKKCTRIQSGPLQVQVDTAVTACCFDSDGKTVAGSLMVESLEAIYAKMQPAEICRTCDQRQSTRSALIYSSIGGKDRTQLTSSSLTKF